MTAPLSIIILTQNSERHLPALLNQLFDGMMEGLVAEVILADTGSTDTTHKIADEAGVVVKRAQTDTQDDALNSAIRDAKGQWLLCIEANSKLSQNWTEEVSKHISAHVGVAATFSRPARSLFAKAVQGLSKLKPTAKAARLEMGVLIPTGLLRKAGGFEANSKKDGFVVNNLARVPLQLTAEIERQVD